MNSTRRIAFAATWIAFAALLGATAYGLLITRFMIYDDEGYVLWSVRQFLAGQPLYDSVFSQYGPFFYVFYSAVQALTGLPFDNETGRLLTLIYWLAASLGCGAIGWRLTRSVVAGLTAAGFAFAALADMTCEPFHPGGMLAALTTAGAAAGLFFNSRHAARAWLICALLGTAMALTKINVGALFLFAAASWLFVFHRPAQSGSLRTRIVAVFLLIAPLVLMRAHWPAPWVAIYTLVFVASGLAQLGNLHALRVANPQLPTRRVAGVCLAATVGLVVVVALAARTSPATLWDAVVVAPLRHPGIYWFPIDWMGSAVVAAVLALLVFAADHFWQTHARRPAVVALLRVAAGSWFLMYGNESATGRLHPFLFQVGPSLAWLMATPLRPGQSDVAAHGRSWLGWIALWQLLQAYPVAGTQQAWASFIWTPLLVAGLWDAFCFWVGELRTRFPVAAAASSILIVATAVAVGHLTRYAHKFYHEAEPLGIPGASSLRLQRDLATTLQAMQRNAKVHGGLVFTFPGMFSFNIWTDKPTPTAANVTHWFSLLDDARQQAIADRLAADPRAVIVIHRTYVGYLITSGFGPTGLLKDFIFQRFQPAVRVGNYDLWVHRGRHVAPIGTLRRETSADGSSWLNIVVGASSSVASLRIQKLEAPNGALVSISPTAMTPWYVTPIDEEGRGVGETRRHVGPIMIERLSRIQIRDVTEATKSSLESLSNLEAQLVDSEGKALHTLRFNEAPGLTAVAPPAAD